MKRREIILGPPGTGKTHHLIERLEQAFDRGIKPEEVAFLAFTKKAADVAVQRAMSSFGFARNRFPYFRTIHSLAFHQNKISRESVMRSENYKDLGEEFGWDFTASYDNFEERPSYGIGKGDELLRCYDLAKAKGISVTAEATSGEYSFGEFAIEHFVKQFEHYKSRNGLFTFNDFLERPVELDVKLVIVDEAQDLTHLQWQFIRESFRNVETVLIAGDDDQCIYQWSGADLSFFLKIDAEVTQLKHSFRCREQIWNMCNRISKKIGQRYPKAWEPVAPGGQVRIERDPFDVDISSGEWLILVRKNRIKSQYFNVCMSSGRIFHDGRCWTNETPWFRGVLAYMKLRRGEKVNAVEALALLKFTSHVRVPTQLYEFVWEDFEWNFEGRPEWYDIANRLDLDKVVYIKRCIAAGEDIFAPGQVRLATIHAAKGGEADNVLLDLRLDGIPLKQFKKDPDSERRVWYVGVSRARQNLVLSGAFKNAAVDI